LAQRWRTSSAALDRRQYGYDRDSNRLYAENIVDSTRSELYAYDDFNQIASFDRGTLNGGKNGLTGAASRSQDWDFDALGNWDSLTTNGGTAETRGHNKQNEITSISGASTPTYDANGNMLTDETGKQFVYDGWNRLVIGKTSGGTTLVTFKHDGLFRKVRETRGGTTLDLYYSSSWQVIEERISGTAVASYVWSPVYIDAMIARDRDSDANGSLDERLYALHDANFNIVALVDTSGAVVERFAYDAFGGFVVLTPAWGSRGSSSYDWKYQFQGLKYDADLSALDDRNRILDPETGRFLQMDPIGFEGGDVVLYRALENVPIGALDPSGLNPVYDWLDRRVDGAANMFDPDNIAGPDNAGSRGGALSGILIGGATGAGIGAAAGPPGILIGGVIGGFVGGVQGSAAGSKAGDYGWGGFVDGLWPGFKGGFGSGIYVLSLLGPGKAKPVCITTTVKTGGANAVRPGQYLAGKAPKNATPGSVLEGQHVNDLGRVERWRAHYDQHGRLIARTDFNAGNKAAGIPDLHFPAFSKTSRPAS